MMNGITILNTIERVETGWGWSIWGVILLIAGIILSVMSFVADMNGDSYASLMIFPIAICIVGSLALFRTAKVTATYNTYEVTISDTVNFNEFQERYEIIDQRGQIYTIKERRP